MTFFKQGHMSPLRTFVNSTARCPLYGTMSPLRSFVPSTALCPPLRSSVPSTALCPLYGPLPALRSSVFSIALYSLYSLLSPLRSLSSLRPFVSSTVLCPLYGHLQPSVPFTLSVLSTPSTKVLHEPHWPLTQKTGGNKAKQAKRYLLIPKMFRETCLSKPLRYHYLFMYAITGIIVKIGII